MTTELDDAVGLALSGRLSRFALRRGRMMRFMPDVAPFCWAPADAGAADWEDAAELARDAGYFTLTAAQPLIPDGWQLLRQIEVIQMVTSAPIGKPAPAASVLGAADVPETLELIARTKPGPFSARTIELGTYLGIREHGKLIAMAGERLSFPGWTEVSAVCTDPDHRGRGLAATMIRAVAALIESRGDRVFLHVRPNNQGAISVYERLGFSARRELAIYSIKPQS